MTRDRPGNRLFAALYDPVTAVGERTVLARHRRWLAEGLSGRVLDLGAGTGAMLPYFAAAADASTSGGDRTGGLSVVALEPDPHMRGRAERRAAETTLDVAFVDGDGAMLPFADGAFDAVVAGLVLCTVPDLDATLDEVARVLRPGGEFRVFEHVRGDGWYGRFQDAAAPAWRVAAAGCHLNRDTDDRLRAHPAFEVAVLERSTPPVPPVTPFVRGRLIARGT